ncbi:putative retrotransposon hot spot (RHS) protein [Trypanosoma cruzi]|uniref:Putative retrotransposon hot spot (RHS) protein n=1 Tax=Trypanosoma cruzi TaxID=5693 RepID=A0A2V2UMR8_TRYCR|nr:putative retrotransposon hot spot (RHS) protein [Trypanosoma cruzi]
MYFFFFVLRHGAQYVVHTVWISLFLRLPVISVSNFFLPYSPFDWSLVFSFNLTQLREQGETMSGNQASGVSRQDRRRARLESEDGTDQSAATRRGAEGTRRPQWTMSSSVEDILLEGSNNNTDMKLNDFLRNYVGGRAAVDEDHNVTMEMFVQEPDAYLQDQQLLELILNLAAYQVYKLHQEGVFFLGQWRDYERKDMVTPLVRGKLNGVLTQLLREERHEAEERLRRAQEMKFTMSTNIEDVLFKGGVRVKDIKLNDFLTLRFDGKGIVATNRDVSLEEFFKEPTEYIHDARVLNEIKKTVPFLSMGRAVMDEVYMEEVVRMLHENGVFSLEQWEEYEGKDTVTPLARGKLNAALSQARISTSVVTSTVLKEYYESVYNARWHHVVEVTDGNEEEQTGMGMEVREGTPPQSWTYKKSGYTLEKVDAVQQSGKAPPVLMVLTSDKGWPYSWEEDEFIRDCYVNCEVERVWQIVSGDLTKWFSSHGRTDFMPERLLLIGTPGIGKSMNAGSYLLYQLLHYDVEKLPVVLYVIGNETFLFEKTTKTVTKYMGGASIEHVLASLSIRGVNAYIIYDVAKGGRKPYPLPNSRGWGMIVVKSTNEDNFGAWEKYKSPKRIIMNCPEKDDVRAMCIWMKRNRPLQEQAEYWKEVRGRMNNVGPILRFIFGKQAYDDRIKACQQAVDGSTASELERNLGIGCCYSSNDSDLSRKLVRVVRVRRGHSIESPLNVLISPHLEREILSRLENEMKQSDFIFFVLRFWDYVPPYIIGKYAVSAFLNEDFMRAIRIKIKELRPRGRRESHSCALKEHSDKSFTRKEVLPPPERLSNPVAMDHWVLYEPKVKNFPLVDAFFFVKTNPKTLVGLRMATAGEHHTTTSTVRQFTEYLAAYFNGWEELSRDMSWEIIYVQHADSTAMNGWQRCDVVDSNNVSRAENREIAVFWEEEVHQYMAAISFQRI